MQIAKIMMLIVVGCCSAQSLLKADPISYRVEEGLPAQDKPAMVSLAGRAGEVLWQVRCYGKPGQREAWSVSCADNDDRDIFLRVQGPAVRQDFSEQEAVVYGLQGRVPLEPSRSHLLVVEQDLGQRYFLEGVVVCGRTSGYHEVDVQRAYVRWGDYAVMLSQYQRADEHVLILRAWRNAEAWYQEWVFSDRKNVQGQSDGHLDRVLGLIESRSSAPRRVECYMGATYVRELVLKHKAVLKQTKFQRIEDNGMGYLSFTGAPGGLQLTPLSLQTLGQLKPYLEGLLKRRELSLIDFLAAHADVVVNFLNCEGTL